MPDKQSVWALLIGIIDRPAEALANVMAYPRWRWVLPALLAISALAAWAALVAPLLAIEAQVQTQQVLARQFSQLPADQAAQVQEQMAAMQTPLAVGALQLVTNMVRLVLTWLAQGVVLYLSILFVGRDVEFKQMLAVVPWLGMPYVLETVVRTAYVVSRGQLIVNHGLSYLVSSGQRLEDARNLAYVALSQVSAFQLWHLILVYALLHGAVKLDSRVAFRITLLYVAVFVGGQLAFVTLQRLLSGGA